MSTGTILFRIPLLILMLSAFRPVVWAQQPVTFQFLPPEVEGTFSLGIYDSKGNLVRTLYKEAAESVFKVGLNGFIVTWDGKADDGAVVKPGRYFARGYVVPKIGAELLEGGTPRAPAPAISETPAFVEIEAIAVGPAGEVFAVARDAAQLRTFLSWDPEGNQKQVPSLEGPPPKLAPGQLPFDARVSSIAVAAGRIWIAAGESIYRLGLYDWRLERVASVGKAAQIAAAAEEIAVMAGTNLSVYTPEGLSQGVVVRSVELGSPHRVYATNKAGEWLLVSEKGEVQRLLSDQLEPLEFSDAPGGKVAAAAGREGSVWLVQDDPESGWELRQFAGDGDFLRQMAGVKETSVLLLAASLGTDVVAIVRREPNGGQRLVALRRLDRQDPAPAAQADEVVVSFEEFVDFELAPAIPEKAGAAENVTVSLAKNPLEPGKAPRIKLKAIVADGSAYLATDDGLVLKRLNGPNVNNASVEKEGKDIILNLTPTGGPAARFKIKGIARTMAFDAGDLEYPPKSYNPGE